MKRYVMKSPPLLLTFILAISFQFLYAQFPSSHAVAGSGTWASPCTVTEAISSQGSGSKTVRGYVVGKPTSSTSIITSNYPDNYALALADSESETDTSNMIFVQIPSNYRATFGLQSNPDLRGKVIKVTGSLTDYYAHPGVKSVSKMEKETSGDGDPPDGDSPYDSTYYSNAIGKTGTNLKNALHIIIEEQSTLSYSEVWDALRSTDEDPNNPNNVVLLYSGRSQGKFTNGGDVDDWNREHVWAKSHGDFGTSQGPGTDIHHLRPTDVTVNSTRGNLDFDNGGSPEQEAPGNYYDSDSWEPRDEVKGDVARMIFYMAVRYEGDNGEPDLEVNNLVNNGSNPFIGKLTVLEQWNTQDPVDDFERRRNDIIYNDYQHNRNPFIDHPEWIDRIWN